MDEIFLCRLIQKDYIEANGNDETIKYVEEALASRKISIRAMLKLLDESIDAQRAKTESIARALDGEQSSEGQIGL